TDGPRIAADDHAPSAPRPQLLRPSGAALGAMAPRRPASCLLACGRRRLVIAPSTLDQARLGWPPRRREHLAGVDLPLAGLSLTPFPGADFRRGNLHENLLRCGCLHARR